jgi:hypothetical protein
MKLMFSSEKVETEFRNTPRKICIAAHTVAFMDGWSIFWAFWKAGEEFQIYTTPRPFFLSIFTPRWCREIQKNGFVQQEIERLSSLSKFSRVLFPSGGTIHWKTGFFVLARETNAKIVVLGIDYSKGFFQGRIVVDSILSPQDKSFQEIKETAIQQLRTYPVRYECMFFLQSLGIPYGDETFPISKRSSNPEMGSKRSSNPVSGSKRSSNPEMGSKQSIWLPRSLILLGYSIWLLTIYSINISIKINSITV